LANGAILVDDYDSIVFDDLRRNFPAWDFIDKRPAPGDFTNGFDESAMGTAAFIAKRTLTFSGSSPSRAARTPKEIKAITRDLEFGLYDRSVYKQQGMRFGDLTAKDVSDITNSIMKIWNDAFYHGNATGSPLEFDGLKSLLAGPEVGATTSVVKTIQEKVVSMMNSVTKDVRPTHVLVNARVRQIIVQEYRLAGAQNPEYVSSRGEKFAAIDTAAGDLPLVVDPFNSVVAGTANVYPTYIVSADKMSWQYIEPLGQGGPEPKIFEIVLNNAINQQFKGVMFGALEMLGAAANHARLNILDRAVVITMVPTS
jgi:hypothetical protein